MNAFVCEHHKIAVSASAHVLESPTVHLEPSGTMASTLTAVWMDASEYRNMGSEVLC